MTLRNRAEPKRIEGDANSKAHAMRGDKEKKRKTRREDEKMSGESTQHVFDWTEQVAIISN